MTHTTSTSRRQALKFLSGVPLLPLSGSLSAATLLSGCGGGGSDDATFVSATFGAMPAPTATADMATTFVQSTLTVTLSDKSTQSFSLAYQPFFLTGTQVPNGSGGTLTAGGYYNINNQPINDSTGAGSPTQFFSDSPDGTSLLTVANPTVSGVSGNTVFALVQFEYTTKAKDGTTDMYGKLPSPIAVLTLDQNRSTGKLSLVKYHNVDTSGVHGLWITCGASLSPWGTHLSSEEYEPDPWNLPSYYSSFITNLGDLTAKPYHYGHLPEVTVKPDGTASIQKHYCLGRISHELVQVMPDNRTVLMGDDATNGGLFVFIADTAKDLSAGTLYVGQLQSSFDTALLAGTSSVAWKWIKLGHATSAEIKTLANTLAKEDIFDVKTADPADPSYTKIFYGGVANWIKLSTNLAPATTQKAAAFLETHRYAYLQGGSMGFTKLEGTAVNVKDKIAYSALQNMEKSMVTNNSAGWNAASKIGLTAALKAGGVMAHTLTGGQTDTDGNAINSEWMPVSTKILLKGEDIATDAMGNTANPNKVANPDNLKFSEKLRTLFIGEDSSQHTNNFLWAYNVDTGALARVMSIPAGGESTGLHAVDEINGWTYIMSNFQHAGDSSYVTSNSALNTAINTNYNNKLSAAVGYLTATSTSIKLNKL